MSVRVSQEATHLCNFRDQHLALLLIVCLWRGSFLAVGRPREIRWCHADNVFVLCCRSSRPALRGPRRSLALVALAKRSW